MSSIFFLRLIKLSAVEKTGAHGSAPGATLPVKSLVFSELDWTSDFTGRFNYLDISVNLVPSTTLAT